MADTKTGLIGDTRKADKSTIIHPRTRARLRNPWAVSLVALLTLLSAIALLFAIVQSFLTKQLDPKGCSMSYMRPSFVHFSDFDTEHTRFATKYNLFLYREGEIDEDPRVKGVPVIFIPGNAGSYKQARSLASEAAYHFYNSIRPDDDAIKAGKAPLDFFSVDFNEDITAFHGQTLLDQAEYLNDAIAYILRLYHSPYRSIRDPNLPDPSSVILVGHSMGGIVARTMLSMSNYQANSINTIITLSAPHARPPVTFDGAVVRIYNELNDYWREAYSQKWANDNPLWHVTLISIAGGGLDTIVPSDYASVASIIPETHGFTVFSSTIPEVWTGMDHLCITWCDELRKAVVRALYDVVDVSRPVQTKPRAERMRVFKRWFLSGLEPIAEKTLQQKEAHTLLTLDDPSIALAAGDRSGSTLMDPTGHMKLQLLSVPRRSSAAGQQFKFLSTHRITDSQETKLHVLVCSVYSAHPGRAAAFFTSTFEFSKDPSPKTRLACKDAAADVIKLPASTVWSKQSFEKQEPFNYLQYNVEELGDVQFIAIVTRGGENEGRDEYLAEISRKEEAEIKVDTGLRELVLHGVSVKFPERRPLSVEVKIPALRSSLLAYKLSLTDQSCTGTQPELFRPLLRQYVTDVYESRFFVNVKDIDINLHGVAPYLPPSYMVHGTSNGLALQLWSDPTCGSPMEIRLQVDIQGSLGKLWMRYRTVFAAFPLVIVALVLWGQFSSYDETGIFMSFAESMNQSFRGSIPAFVLGLTVLTLALSTLALSTPSTPALSAASTSTVFGSPFLTAIFHPFLAATHNNLLGLSDPFFWFLVPLFALISAGLCILINYTLSLLTLVLSFIYAKFHYPRADDSRRSATSFAVTTTRQRLATTAVLLLLVSTAIPYQFAFLVLCIVQLATAVRAVRLARDTAARVEGEGNANFSNYAHSVLVLMIWILPINVPVLVVWIRNLAVQWMTPFASHHNILSVMPYILLVETLSTGRMVMRISSRLSLVTSALLFSLALFAAIYGVSFAYMLHHIVNLLCAWLALVHFAATDCSRQGVNRLFGTTLNVANGPVKERPQ
ncbi:GPI inositol-deacylase-like protein [Eremomyces bilateralis CBS 781.70]|uniref:GPI inositol-deacylase n=1 Tax=Eremomyces bilateralis CBS 781.70 TaxID=1392243 RepID=A0A6G1G167_9PEZI|nr:GPI inositol-deacylase-like protein [Eremomyces bilateralis CBS 781.70]KAF1811670.1 GPI inositol-deacylase-like protein [Eremomyces bilateralis CBS 781.70]